MLALRTPTVPKPLKKVVKRTSFDTIEEEPAPMEWEFLKEEDPDGSDVVFTEGKLKNKTFLEVTMKTPEQYLACKKAKSLIVEMRTYVNWVERHFAISVDKEEIRRKSEEIDGSD